MYMYVYMYIYIWEFRIFNLQLPITQKIIVIILDVN